MKRSTPQYLADRLGEIKAQKAALDEERALVEKSLKPHLSHGKAVEGDYFRITLSEGISRRLDPTAMKRLLTEEALSTCRKASAYTRFNINARNGDEKKSTKRRTA